MSCEIIRPHHGQAEPDTERGHKSDELRKWPTNPGSQTCAHDAISRRKTESLLPAFDPDQDSGAETRRSFLCWRRGPGLALVKVWARMTNVLITASLAPVYSLYCPTPALHSSCSECHSVSESHKMRVFLLLPLLIVMTHISPSRRWMNHNPSCIRQMIKMCTFFKQIASYFAVAGRRRGVCSTSATMTSSASTASTRCGRTSTTSSSGTMSPTSTWTWWKLLLAPLSRWNNLIDLVNYSFLSTLTAPRMGGIRDVPHPKRRLAEFSIRVYWHHKLQLLISRALCLSQAWISP